MSTTGWWIVYAVSLLLPFVGVLAFLWAMAGGVRPEQRGGAWGALAVAVLATVLWLGAV